MIDIWVTPEIVFHERKVIPHRKDLCQGDYLMLQNQRGDSVVTPLP